jgi:hypothetical protein
MQGDESTTTQVIVFQSEMPDLARIQNGNGAMKSEAENGEKDYSIPASISSPAPINVSRTITEADLTFKGPGPESDGDAASESRDNAVTLNQNRLIDADRPLQSLDLENLEFFWDGRYHQTSYIKQYDILDDGEPPPPRAGWPIQQLNLRVIVLNLEHPPLLKGPQDMSYFSLELHLGDQVYKTPVCMGDSTDGFIKFDQLFTAHIDDDVLEAVAASLRDGTVGPVLTAVVYDCGRRFKNTVLPPAHAARALLPSESTAILSVFSAGSVCYATLLLALACDRIRRVRVGSAAHFRQSQALQALGSSHTSMVRLLPHKISPVF